MKFGRVIQYSLIWSIIISTTLYFAGGYASAASVTLAWDANAESQLAGYNLYYHPCPTGEQKPVDQQNPNISIKKLQFDELSDPSQPVFEASGLENNQNYAFAVTAYTTDGQESGFSNTVHYQTPEITDSTSTDQIIIDNGSPGTSYTGTWATSGGADPWESDSLWARGGDTYTWSFTPAKTGTYEVSMWWTQYASRSKNVPVSIHDSGGTHTIQINQQTDGGQWNTIGKYTYIAGVTYAITITSQSEPTSTCADAVKIAYVDSNIDSNDDSNTSSPVVIIDNGGPGTSYTGTWATSGGADPWESDSLWARGGDTYTWSFTPAKTGTYEVSMWWTQYASRSKNVPVSIHDSGGTHAIQINQRTDGGQWNIIGKYTYIAGVTYAITITSQSEPTSTCADAVKIAYVDSNIDSNDDSNTSSPFVIDNGDPGSSYTGTWATSGGADPWESDSLWARGGNTYTWTFTPDITGTYEIAMWWTQYASRSKSIPVRIDDSAGIHTVRIDQQINGGKWNLLGTYNYKAGVSYAVTITSQSEPTSTCADAVKFTLTSADSGTTSTSSLPSETDQSRATASSSLGTDSAVSVTVSTGPAIEVGEVPINHNWTRVVLGRSFVDPVVVATPASLNDAAPAVVRIRNIESDSFEIRLQEWDYLDGIHSLETTGYIVMERGSYSLPDGTRLEASYYQTDGAGAFQPVLFEKSFQEAPVVIASVSSYNEIDAVTGRLRNIDTEGFEYRMQEQEAGDGFHVDETIAYIAWEPSSGNLNGFSYEVNRTDNVINNRFFTIDFQTGFTSAPVFLCDIQTSSDEETANLRWRNKSTASLEVRIDEEISSDSEVDHANETGGYIAIE